MRNENEKLENNNAEISTRFIMEKDIILQIAVCEDDPADVALLARHIEKSGIAAELCSFESGDEFLASFCARKYDLIFMDIYMKGISGVDAVREIRRLDRNAEVAFMTASPDHALESYRLGVSKYLEKPITPDAVKEALEYALLKRRTAPLLTLKTSGGREENIPLDSILYLESRGHAVEVHTFSGVITTSRTARLDEIEKLLPQPQFLRCHRSFLINLDHVVKADRELHVFVMKNGGMASIRRGHLVKYERELDGWYLYKAGRDG